jgi:hypothetical protein
MSVGRSLPKNSDGVAARLAVVHERILPVPGLACSRKSRTERRVSQPSHPEQNRGALKCVVSDEREGGVGERISPDLARSAWL